MGRGGYVYMMANRPRGVLYIGVTADLTVRIAAHRMGTGSQFVRRYSLNRLVYIERFEEIEAAIAREKQIKKWNRDWKIRLINESNPDWIDLYDRINF